jgi:hypothetical protein
LSYPIAFESVRPLNWERIVVLLVDITLVLGEKRLPVRCAHPFLLIQIVGEMVANPSAQLPLSDQPLRSSEPLVHDLVATCLGDEGVVQRSPSGVKVGIEYPGKGFSTMENLLYGNGPIRPS